MYLTLSTSVLVILLTHSVNTAQSLSITFFSLLSEAAVVPVFATVVVLSISTYASS